jgi:hypothetical protein
MMKVEDQLTLILTKLDDQSKGIHYINRKITDVQSSIKELKVAKADFERWRPQVDTNIFNLFDCIDSLCQQIDELKSSSVSLTSHLASSEHGSVFFKSSVPAHLGASCSKATMGPCGHDVDPSHRRSGLGGGATLKPPPIKGEPPTLKVPSLVSAN